MKNGELLRRAGGSFDVLITGDRNIEFQQNLSTLPIAVVVLIAKNNRIETLRPLIPKILAVLERIQPGQLFRVQEQGYSVS
ncbi:MAG TPA: hypothetical protein VEK15_02095 [Vicinamibacteria bacterium]|nr:hypothetical protein [Vicinamibacteria bacterium]